MRAMFSLLVLCALASATGPAALADLAKPDCGLPLCDVAGALTQFQSAAPQDQASTLKRLSIAAYQTQAPAALKNLNSFAVELEGRAELVELSKFFSAASAFCTEVEDDEYIVAFAKQSEQAAAKKLARLQPLLEGVYAAEIACVDKSDCPETRINRLVIMDALYADNLEISLVASAVNASIYRFPNVLISGGGKVVEGIGGNSAGALAKIHLEGDAGKLTGYVETIDFRLNVTARSVPGASLIALFDQQLAQPPANPISPKIFESKLVGSFDGHKAELKINLFPEDVQAKREESVGATLSILELKGYKLRFHAGRFFPKSGILLLVASSPTGTIKLGLTIRPRADGSGYDFNGVSFSSESARVNALGFQLDVAGALP
ncbi:MAG: hypothetical protein HY075_07295 [Deltaproteobacteria bacterium]|nr:hypothetical protein [Deltaproteobacteria bacterium]